MGLLVKQHAPYTRYAKPNQDGIECTKAKALLSNLYKYVVVIERNVMYVSRETTLQQTTQSHSIQVAW